MKLSYALSFAYIRAAFRLHRRQTLLRRVNLYIWPALTITAFVGMIIFSSNKNSELFAQCFAFGVGFLWMSIGMPIARYYNIRRCFKQHFPSTRTDPTTSMEIDDERIHTGIPGVSVNNYLWNGIVGFAQNEKATLLYLDKNRFLFLPTCAMSTAQRAELNDLIARHVARKQP